MSSNRFLIPLTLSASNSQRTSTSSGSLDLIESSCSRAIPTSLISWTCAVKDHEGLQKDEQKNSDISGVAMGCSDGSIYVFRATPMVQEHVSSNASSPGLQNTLGNLGPFSPTQRSRMAQSTSRSSSPSSVRSSLAPFSVSSRSRIVSGITLEQAEAPKNYVDFEDEPEKLKDMLKGKGPKERTSLSEGVRSPSPSARIVRSPGPTPRTENIAGTGTPPPTSQSVTRAPSPTLSSSPALAMPTPMQSSISLAFHLLPPRLGESHSISCMEVVRDSQALLCLQDTGYLSVFSLRDGSCLSSCRVEDEEPLPPPEGIKAHDMSHHIWSWKRLQVTIYGEKVLVLVCATDPSAISGTPSNIGDHHSEEDASEITRIAIFELKEAAAADVSVSPLLEKLGEWCMDGPVCGPILSDPSLDQGAPGPMMFFHITPARHLVMRQLWLSAPKRLNPSLLESERSNNNSMTSLPLPNPFKALKMRSTERVAVAEDETPQGMIAVGDEVDLGEISFGDREISPIAGIRIVESRAMIWSDSAMILFDLDTKASRMSPLGSAVSITSIKDVRSCSPGSYIVTCRDRAEVYAVRKVDPNNDEVEDHSPGILQLETLREVPLPNHAISHILPSGCILVVRRDEKARRALEVIDLAELGSSRLSKASPGKLGNEFLWKAKRPSKDNDVFLTALLPLELDAIIAGYSDGFIRRSSLATLAAPPKNAAADLASDVSLNALVTSLFLVRNRRTSSQIIIGGGDDGSIACWDFGSLSLAARWILFTSPLQNVLEMPESCILKGCILCIACDGTIAIIAIDGCQFLYLIPGSIAPLVHVYVDSDNILLVYSHGWARLWDLRSQEFRRSLTWDKAAEIVAQGEGWVEMTMNHVQPSLTVGVTAGTPSQAFCNETAAATLLVDLTAMINQIMASVHTPREKQRQTAVTTQYRTVLSGLLTFGLSLDIDRLCEDGLGTQSSGTSAGFMSRDALVSFASSDPRTAWTISPEVSAARALGVIALLRALALFEEFADAANTVTTFYASSLEGLVGSGYRAPSPTYLANAWLNGAGELRASIHLLFDAGIAYLSDEDANRLVETWEQLLPCRQHENDKQSHIAAMALFLCGYLAVAKYSLLSTVTLADISKSIAYYLHDDTSVYRSLAIDLCSKGFTVWQQYVDAMEMLRALFLLATSSRKETISTQNAGLLARAAVLRIASSNSPLFMTTLAFDILHPQNLEHRKSVMQLVAFFIRKQPLVLYPNLPRLVEAVVKSLDPNATSDRDAVLDTATEILGHVVKTFPTVDFHTATQRLAVGTSEGAVIMYDLKTATRLYVLDAHKKRPVAISFSPDGRRLVTVSLEEGVVLVWKVGSSFSSFFNPGAPPRQGHGGSEPFKRLPFNVGDEAKMTTAGTLEYIRFEWPADRSVKLKIRESTLTFST